MHEPKVTVALLTRNRPQLLRIALASVLAQREVELDVVVLDNASTDDTPDVVRSFQDPRITYLRHEHDIGIIRNWNRGIAEATDRSPFVSIFHDDDVMLDGFLAESARGLLTHPSAGMSLCLAQYIGQDGSLRGLQSICDVKDGLNGGLDFIELFVEGRCVPIPPPIVLFRADALRAAGFADSPHTRGTCDMNLYYRVAALADVLMIPRALVQYRLHEGSDTELLNRTAGGTFWYGTMAERVDALAYLLRSPRAADPAYRAWLTERLLAANAHASTAIHPSVPQMYHTWDARRAIFLDQLDAAVPAGEALILVDDGQLGLDAQFSGRRLIPFLERDGRYWGPPRDASEAVECLERLRAQGARWLAVAWPSFWWLDQYGAFDRHLRTTCRRALESAHGILFEIP
jgi:glycosyltransferase involved in cell wall biosynthesis